MVATTLPCCPLPPRARPHAAAQLHTSTLRALQAALRREGWKGLYAGVGAAAAGAGCARGRAAARGWAGLGGAAAQCGARGGRRQLLWGMSHLASGP